MFYINSKTLEYPITEGFIRTQYPASYAVPFVPPAPYVAVAESLQPEFDPVTQRVVEAAPVQTADGWKRSWSVVSKFTEYTDEQGVLHTVAQQEAEAIAQDRAQKSLALQTGIIRDVQQRLDQFAKTRGYDGILSACTYATSLVSKFATEGQYCVNARDLTWAKLYEILQEVESGTRPIPTGYQSIYTELPVLQWPN